MYYKEIILNGSCFNEHEIENVTTSALTKQQKSTEKSVLFDYLFFFLRL